MKEDRGDLYSEVGVLGGSCFIGGDDGGHVIEVVGLIFPLAFGGEKIYYMTLPAAKCLLIDLRDAIEECIKHKQGGGGGEADE
jgi:hypothetical protein